VDGAATVPGAGRDGERGGVVVVARLTMAQNSVPPSPELCIMYSHAHLLFHKATAVRSNPSVQYTISMYVRSLPPVRFRHQRHLDSAQYGR